MKKYLMFIFLLSFLSFVSAVQVGFEKKPKILLIFPENATIDISYTPFVIEFNFIIESENKIDNCSLILNDSIVATNYYNKNITSVIMRHEMGLGEFIWKIICFDVNGNSAVSEERALVLNKKIEIVHEEITEKEKGFVTTRFFVSVALLILIFFVLYEIFTSESFRRYLEIRKKHKLRERLRKKILELEKRKF
ncbi:MAG: hypothetical protein QXF25_00685 [Candidatus Pacearchaeota archaeon]